MSNIENIADLIFFTEKGYQIPAEKTYVIEWEIQPNSQIANNFISNPKGHFIFDIEDDTKTITAEVDDGGKIIDCSVNIYGTYDTSTMSQNISEFSGEDIILLNVDNTYYRNKGHYKNRLTGTIESYGDEQMTETFSNTVKITINTLTESVSDEFPINYIFSDVEVDEYDIAINSSSALNIKYMNIKSLTVAELAETEKYKTTINALIELTQGYENLFPCVRYLTQITQDKVSTDFIAASTFIIAAETSPGKYGRPSIESSNYSLRFEFQKDSEMRFISSDSIANIIWNDYYEVSTDTTSNINLWESKSTPIYFSVGFQTEIEGCYQNIMIMYIKDKKTGKKYVLGLVTFLTEVEGEDERYRALLGNLGIPDPMKYPNIFKSLDPLEQGTDWTLINTKSKELMLTYENIFPYVGTYKALLGAVKFLGYQDLIFKEWYKIKDLNGRDKLVTLQNYDLLTGKTLQSKLKRIGVSYGDFERYKKLNRLSMIYHLNQIDEETGEDINYLNASTGQFDSVHYDNPITKKVYEYRTDEILAKLYSVKLWLERYILGVNCYISDICGEGLVISRVKTQGYVTEHYIKDFTTIGSFTPKITEHSEFIDSSCKITCSLNEFDSLTLEDYEYYLIDQFITDTSIPNNFTEPIYYSAPLETLVVANEFQYQLTNNETLTGTLIEFTDSSYVNNPIFLQDNEIKFYDDSQCISKIDKGELPIIEIIQGNLRSCNGNWKSNILYSIKSIIDLKTGNLYYTLYSEDDGAIICKCMQKITLVPYIVNPKPGTYGKSEIKSELIYTTLNKWNVPLFIMRNYKIQNSLLDESKDPVLDGDFILEIVEGRMIFRNKTSELNSGKANGCEISFSNNEELEGKEQNIYVDYTYMSNRLPIYTIDTSKLSEYTAANTSLSDASISECVTTNKTVDMYVNRLGTYSISVNAYNMFNQIFVNKSDDYTTISAKPIGFDIVMNNNFVKNDEDFYSNNAVGELLADASILSLYNKLDEAGDYPIYPLNYRIYDIDPVLDNPNMIEYDNISYAIDTPKTGDFIIFNNFTEKILDISKVDTSVYQFKLLDENPNNDTIKNSSLIGLCIYDNIRKEIEYDLYPLSVKEISILKSSPLYDVNNSYIQVELTEDTSIFTKNILDVFAEQCAYQEILNSSSFLINSLNGYIYSANEYVIDSSYIDTSIIVDYDNNETIIYDSSLHFVETQVIKICYSTETAIHNNYTLNVLDNEAAYTIKDVSVLNSSCYYVIDGIVDKQKLNNKLYHNLAMHSMDSSNGKATTNIKYKVKVCPAHLRAALYILRVDDSGEEITNFYNNSTVCRTQVMYEPTPLLFNSYLDTTYSAYICDYDPKLLQNIWSDPASLFSSGKLYRYRNTPVTISQGRTLLIMPLEDQTTFTNMFNDTLVNMRVHWDWKTYLIDDHENWHTENENIGKQTVFKSANKILSIKPELLGTQQANMECTDIYGNVLLNECDGYIYVDGTAADAVTPADTETRDIYYKNVYIVGFESLFTPIDTVANIKNSQYYSLTNANNMSASRTTNVNPVTYSYKIYYNDGTVAENEGATFTLLTLSGNLSKSNKVKYTIPDATLSHKYVADLLNGVITIDEPTEFDLVSDLDFSLDIKQYGTSVTTDIYNLSFTVKPFPAEGIEHLEEYIIRNYITDIKYTLRRSEGEVETMKADRIEDAMLKIVDFKFMHNTLGNIDYVPANTSGQTLIGMLQLTVQFDVVGVQNEIKTSSIETVTLL